MSRATIKSTIRNGGYGCFVRSVDEPDEPPKEGSLPFPRVKIDLRADKQNKRLMEVPPFKDGQGQMYLMLDDIDLSYLVAFAVSHGYMDEGRRFKERVEEIIREAPTHGWKLAKASPTAPTQPEAGALRKNEPKERPYDDVCSNCEHLYSQHGQSVSWKLSKAPAYCRVAGCPCRRYSP